MWFVQFTLPVNRKSVWGHTGGMKSDLGYLGKLWGWKQSFKNKLFTSCGEPCLWRVPLQITTAMWTSGPHELKMWGSCALIRLWVVLNWDCFIRCCVLIGCNRKKRVLIYSNHASMPKTTQLFRLEKWCNRKAKGSLYRQIVRIASQVLALERYNHATVIKLFTSKTCDLSLTYEVYNWSVVHITALVSLHSRCVALQDFEESHAGSFAMQVLRQREALIRNK